MRDSQRFRAQADLVQRLAATAGPAERAVYETIASGWRKLAEESLIHEQEIGDTAPDPEPERDLEQSLPSTF